MLCKWLGHKMKPIGNLMNGGTVFMCRRCGFAESTSYRDEHVHGR